MLQKLLIALGLREKPRRSQLTIWTYEDKPLPEKLTKFLQDGDIWHVTFTNWATNRKETHSAVWDGDKWILNHWNHERLADSAVNTITTDRD